MRENKYRCWNKIKKIMVYNNEDNGKDYWDGYKASDIEAINDIFNNSKYIFMQYTGLKDKNGKEIYEGDILAYLDNRKIENWEVKFGEWSCNCQDFYCSEDGIGWYVFGYYKYIHTTKTITEKEQERSILRINNKCIVVGNIYEDKLLLEDKL